MSDRLGRLLTLPGRLKVEIRRMLLGKLSRTAEAAERWINSKRQAQPVASVFGSRAEHGAQGLIFAVVHAGEPVEVIAQGVGVNSRPRAL